MGNGAYVADNGGGKRGALCMANALFLIHTITCNIIIMVSVHVHIHVHVG